MTRSRITDDIHTRSVPHPSSEFLNKSFSCCGAELANSAYTNKDRFWNNSIHPISFKDINTPYRSPQDIKCYQQPETTQICPLCYITSIINTRESYKMNLQETYAHIQTHIYNQSIPCHFHFFLVLSSVLVTLLIKIHCGFPLPIIWLVIYQIPEYQKRHFTENFSALKNVKQYPPQLLLLWHVGLPGIINCDNRQIIVYRL